MRAVLLLLPLLLLTSTLRAEELPQQSPTDTPLLGLVNGEHVNIRAGPALNYEVLWSLPQGAEVHLLAKKGSWFSLELPVKVPVYIAKSFLQFEGTRARVRGQRVRVRAGPGMAYSSLGVLADHEVVLVRQMVGEWAQVQPPPECRGWINESFVTFFVPQEERSSHGDHQPVQRDRAAGSPDSEFTGASERPEAAGPDR